MRRTCELALLGQGVIIIVFVYDDSLTQLRRKGTCSGKQPGNISNQCTGPGLPPAASWGQHPHAAEDGSTNGNPSQPTAYQLGWYWLLPCLFLCYVIAGD